MAKSIDQLADECVERLRSSGTDVVTLPWKSFYEFTGRERLRDTFIQSFQTACKARGLVFNSGQHVVVIAKDFDFAPFTNNRS